MQIADIPFKVHAHVLENTPFCVLLGRPFEHTVSKTSLAVALTSWSATRASLAPRLSPDTRTTGPSRIRPRLHPSGPGPLRIRLQESRQKGSRPSPPPSSKISILFDADPKTHSLPSLTSQLLHLHSRPMDDLRKTASTPSTSTTSCGPKNSNWLNTSLSGLFGTLRALGVHIVGVTM